MVTNMITYKIAREYVSRGWPVFPVALRSDDEGKVNKKPVVPWREYQERLPTDEELHQWFDSGTHSGIGMATGKLPRIVVVDEDSNVARLSSSLVVRTISGGHHYYFRWTEELRNAVKIEGQPLDFRGDGGYVVLPPSSLGDHAYTWEKEVDPMFLSPLPDEILKKLSVKPPRGEYKPVLGQGDDLPRINGIGERNHVATRVAGILVAGMNPKLLDTAGWSAFSAWNQTHVAPPLEDKELKTTWESIVSIDARNHPKKNENAKNLSALTGFELESISVMGTHSDEKEGNKEEHNENVSVNGSVNDSYKRSVNFELTENKLRVISQLKNCTVGTPCQKVAGLLRLLFEEYPSESGWWLHVAQNWPPRRINWVINRVVKLHVSGRIRKHPAACFSYFIQRRKKRKSL